MLKIINYPNDILRQKSQPVANILSPEIQKLIPEMMETMIVGDGVGLAAPQIGQNVRLVVIKHEDDEFVIFNPKIIGKSILREWGEEGCLSLPHKFGQVKRHKKITVEYQDENNEKQVINVSGMLARIFQHEIDHLDGILFIDRAKNVYYRDPEDN